MSDFDKWGFIFCSFIASLIAATILIGLYITHDAIPVCQEDQVIVGQGNFEATSTKGGKWSSYGCGPSIDDYVGSSD